MQRIALDGGKWTGAKREERGELPRDAQRPDGEFPPSFLFGAGECAFARSDPPNPPDPLIRIPFLVDVGPVLVEAPGCGWCAARQAWIREIDWDLHPTPSVTRPRRSTSANPA